MNLNNVLIITGSNAVYGNGHAIRSKELKKALEKSHFLVNLINYMDKNWKYIKDHIKSSRYRHIILDMPIYHQKLLNAVCDKKVMALDYFGNKTVPLTIGLFNHKETQNNGVKLFGLKYAIIKEEIENLRYKNGYALKNINKVKKILIIMGSGDQKNYGFNLSKKLLEKNFHVTLVEGENVTNRTIIKHSNFIYRNNPKNIATLMQNCDFAFSNGGTTMLEFLSLGKPVHVYPQNNAEKIFSQYVLDQGGIVSNDPNNFKIPSPRFLNKVCLKAFQMVDCKGKYRIIDKLKGI